MGKWSFTKRNFIKEINFLGTKYPQEFYRYFPIATTIKFPPNIRLNFDL